MIYGVPEACASSCLSFALRIMNGRQRPEPRRRKSRSRRHPHYSARKNRGSGQKLDAFLAATPRHQKAGVVAFTLGRCRSELKQYPQAVAAYEKAIAFKDPAVLQLAYLGLGEAATYAHDYEKAAFALELALRGQLKPDRRLPRGSGSARPTTSFKNTTKLSRRTRGSFGITLEATS